MLEKKKKSVDTLQEETDLMEVLSKLLELEKEKHKAWILGNVTRIPRHELPQTLDFSDFLPLFT